MRAAHRPDRANRRLMAVDRSGRWRHLRRDDLSRLFSPGDLVVINDAATIPAGLDGRHRRSGDSIEIRLAGFVDIDDATRFVAVAFGPGDHATPTELRAAPPPLAPGDRLDLGPLVAVVCRRLDHPRFVELRFEGEIDTVMAGLAAHGHPIQYAHVPEPVDLWDTWTSVAARPFAFEPPSAGFALDWQTLAQWQARGIGVATLTHAAGISSTGDLALDARLPIDEPYLIPRSTADRIATTMAAGGRIVAIGTTVVRALEAAAAEGGVASGPGVATGRIGPDTTIRVVDTVLSGMHEPGESHFELLRAFAPDRTLRSAHRAATEAGYHTHEFGDALLLERAA